MNFLGIPDEEFIRGQVPMTKQEIRILTLAKARIDVNDIVFDIGAGTGSLSIEAARQTEGSVYAIERQKDGVALIKANAEKFGVSNINVLAQEAPACLYGLPDCDVAIIGGSGGKLISILKAVDAKLKQNGRIVLNCIAVQTLAACLAYFRENDSYAYTAIQAQVSRLRTVGPYDMAEAINPIYIVTGEKIAGGK